MSTAVRVFLYFLAVSLALVIYSLGTSFTYGAETIERAQGSEIFWLLLAVVFASPLWLPATLSRPSRPLSGTARWFAAAALLVPLYYTGAVTLHQFQLYPHQLFSLPIFTVSAILSLGCIAAIAMLLLPRVRRANDKAA